MSHAVRSLPVGPDGPRIVDWDGNTLTLQIDQCPPHHHLRSFPLDSSLTLLRITADTRDTEGDLRGISIQGLPLLLREQGEIFVPRDDMDASEFFYHLVNRTHYRKHKDVLYETVLPFLQSAAITITKEHLRHIVAGTPLH